MPAAAELAPDATSLVIRDAGHAPFLGAADEVAQAIGQAIIEVFDAERAGYLIAGFEVPHAHIHVFPANDMSGYNLANVTPADQTDQAKMDEAAELRAALDGVIKD